MLISRISAVKGEKLDMLVEKLVRPYHDAFEPLLPEAMREKLIAEQPLEMIYFMLLHAMAEMRRHHTHPPLRNARQSSSSSV